MKEKATVSTREVGEKTGFNQLGEVTSKKLCMLIA